MKLPVWLERTLSTTNPIENLNGAIRRVTRNVKRWRDGVMVRRWVATAILEAARCFKRLRGYQGMPLPSQPYVDLNKPPALTPQSKLPDHHTDKTAASVNQHEAGHSPESDTHETWV